DGDDFQAGQRSHGRQGQEIGEKGGNDTMISAEQNEMLTRVGPGTSAGELLRRYWHPIAIATDISEENPVKFIRILGEDLVLFQSKRGGGPSGGPLFSPRCFAFLRQSRRTGHRLFLSWLAL